MPFLFSLTLSFPFLVAVTKEMKKKWVRFGFWLQVRMPHGEGDAGV